MSRTALLPIACAMALAACGSEREPEVNATNASVAEVAEQVREASGGDDFIQPGKWVSQVRFEEMSMPGMPADTTQRMNEMMGAGRSLESCLSEEDSKRPSEGFFAGNDSCRYERFTMAGGKIDASLRCTGDGVTQLMEMEGSYSPDRYSLRMTSTMEGPPGPAGDMKMRMRIDARRVGECEPAPEQGK